MYSQFRFFIYKIERIYKLLNLKNLNRLHFKNIYKYKKNVNAGYKETLELMMWALFPLLGLMCKVMVVALGLPSVNY